MRTTKNQIESKLQYIAKLANLPTSKQQAIEMKQDRYLHCEYASCYGGYRLINVDVESGGHFGAFGLSSTMGRLKANEFYNFLNGIESTLQYSKNKAEEATQPTTENSKYYNSELSKVNIGATKYAPTFKIFANGNGQDTKHISLNNESAKELINFLQTNFNL
jgi:hypothetical protein